MECYPNLLQKTYGELFQVKIAEMALHCGFLHVKSNKSNLPCRLRHTKTYRNGRFFQITQNCPFLAIFGVLFSVGRLVFGQKVGCGRFCTAV